VFPSPDGNWIGYVDNNFTLKKIPAAGGAPVSLLTANGPSRGASWGPNDTIVFATGEATTGLMQIPAAGGAATVLTRPNRDSGEGDHVSPAWLPDGQGVLYTILGQAGLDEAKVAVFDVASGTSRVLIQAGYSGRYLRGGILVYAAAGALWATKFDLGRREVVGTPVKVLSQVAVGPVGGFAHFDVAENGTLVYTQGARHYNERTRVPVWVDRHGRELPIGAPPDAYQHVRVSPDGRHLAVMLRGDLYILNLAGPQAPPARLTVTAAMDWYPVWTHDSRRLVFGSWRGGGFSNIYMQDIDSAEAVRLTDSPDMQSPDSISKDGTVIFHSFPKDLHALRLGPPHEMRTLVGSPQEERNSALSPDERWLAYEAESPSRAGRLEVFVRSFPDVERGPWQVTTDGGTFPLWSRDSRELFYLRTDGRMMAVPVDPLSRAWKPGTPEALFRGPYHFFGDGTMGRHHDIAADGRFLMLKDSLLDAGAAPAYFVVVQEWLAEIARLLS
jgi:serine/threonine-protein kinase